MASSNQLSRIGGKSAAARTIIKRVAKLAKVEVDSYKQALPGDLAGFTYAGADVIHHIGLVVKVSGSKVYLIEGNSANKVAATVRSATSSAYALTFVRPVYDKTFTAQSLIALAKKEVGQREQPDGTNITKYNTWYYGKKVKGDAYPWCAVFQSWLFAHFPKAKQVAPAAKPEAQKPVTQEVSKPIATNKTYTVIATKGLNIRTQASASSPRYGAVTYKSKLTGIRQGSWLMLTRAVTCANGKLAPKGSFASMAFLA
jgi:hypothetical protein